MKAAVVTGFTEPLEIQDRPIPAPGPGQVLVRIEACGLCHTDIHAAHGDWPVKPTPPFVPGHEGVGIIEQVGAGRRRRARSATGSPSPGSATRAASCGYCVRGWETLCEQQQNTGYSIDGGVRRVRRGGRRLRRRRSRTPSRPFDAAPLTCAGVTTYKAIKVADIRPTERVAHLRRSAASATSPSSTPGWSAAPSIAVDVEDDKLRAGHRARRRPRRQRRHDRPGRRASRRSAGPTSPSSSP